MINYIKTHKSTAEDVLQMNEVHWNDDKYLKPVDVDAWLLYGMFDFSFLLLYFLAFMPFIFALDIEDLTESQQNCSADDNTHKIGTLERQLKEKDDLIEQLLEQIHQMKSSFHAWVDRTSNEPVNDMTESSGKNFSVSTEVAEQTHVAKIPIREDQSYFSSYAHYDIHYDMLSVRSI